MAIERDVEQLWQDVGELQERHTTGLSRQELGAFRGRFPAFCRDVLGFELTPQQMEAAAVMRDGVTQLAVIGGNGLGKDTLTAARAIFEAFVLDALALLSGPSDRQVREVLMRREVGRLLRAARGKLRYDRFTMAVRIPGREPAGILAFTASDPDKFTGHHAPRIFIGLTEGQGVPEELWQAAQKCRVGDGLFLAVGNPNKAAGPLYAASRSPTWETLFWSAFDHPNLIKGREVIPGGPTVEWERQMAAEYGADSPFYISAVLGQFPPVGSVDSLLRLDWIEAAFDRGDEAPPYFGMDPLPLLALDVARSLNRDENVVAIVQGPRVHSLHPWRSRDTVDTADRFLELADRTADKWYQDGGRKLTPGNVPDLRLIVDAPGVGAGVIDTCRAEPRNRRVSEWWGWNPATDSKRFANLRAESHWHVRKLLEEGEAILPRDEKLKAELLALEWSENNAGQVQIIGKDELRKVLGRSPDRSDPVVMGLYRATSRSGLGRTFEFII